MLLEIQQAAVGRRRASAANDLCGAENAGIELCRMASSCAPLIEEECRLVVK